MELNRAIKERHSCRRFTTKKPDWRDIVEAIDAAIKAPLAGNIPTLKFILVDEPEKIAKLAEACQQDFVADASYVIVVCSKDEQVKRSYDERAERYCRQQSGAAIENFLLKITELGLATCWTGEFSDVTVKNTLQIPDDIVVEAVLPIGYEKTPKSSQRAKQALDRSMFFNVWNNKYMKPMRKIEAL